MALLVSAGVGLLTACGLYLLLRPRVFSVILGLTLLSYAVNALIFFGGRLSATTAPLALPGAEGIADPLPQALVLTAIVIGFGMTAYLVALALRASAETGTDHVDGRPPTDTPDGKAP
jgi:multicomponent K+:H+ antiporter subunit C